MSNPSMVQEINNAIGAHGAWKLRLRTAINCGKSDVDPAVVRCDDKCDFGKWIHGPSIDAMTKAGKPYEVITRLHREFHQTAANVLENAISARKLEAEKLLGGEFTDRSEKLVRALTKWKGEVA